MPWPAYSPTSRPQKGTDRSNDPTHSHAANEVDHEQDQDDHYENADDGHFFLRFGCFRPLDLTERFPIQTSGVTVLRGRQPGRENRSRVVYEEEKQMSAVLIVVIIVVVLAIGAAVVLGRRAQARRQLERERLAERADAHRDEAQVHASKATGNADEQRAKQAEAAEREEAAERHERLAQERRAEANRLAEEADAAASQNQRERERARAHGEKADGIEEKLR
jgi:hypothetical protein